MRKTAIIQAVVLVFFVICGIHADASNKAIVGGNVVNPDGAPSLKNAVILIDDNKIIQVGKLGKVKIPQDAEIIDVEGKWVIPGLIDSHIHFFQSGGIYTRPDVIDLRKYVPYVDQELSQIKKHLPDTFARYLRCGITSVVDMGGPSWNFEVRELARQTDLAPRVAVAGPLISTYQPDALTTDDPPIIKVNTIEEALALVQKQIEKKTDFIKIWYIVRSGQTPEDHFPLIKATIEESHKKGFRVIVHATQLDTAKAAVKAGADILAHSVSDKIVDKEFIKLLKKHKVIYSTTLIVNEGYKEALTKKVKLSLEEQGLANPYIVSTLFDLYQLPEEADPKKDDKWVNGRNESIKISQQNLDILQDAGVTIAANTDAGNIGTLHGPALFREFELMAEAGLTPRQILTAATINNAKLMGQQLTLGTIEPNKLADLVILNSDPLLDILSTSDIHLVVKDGNVYKPDQIIKKTAEDVVQQQVNAYNARDIEAFLATYSPGCKIYYHPDTLYCSGLEEIKQRSQAFFESNPNLHVESINRIVMGSFVINREKVTGLANNQIYNTAAVYKVQNGLIQQVWIIRE
jgi:imidazolonepropionase-like amidohydrolase